MTQFHTAIIGAGSGGITLAVGLARVGKKVVLIERRQVGGDCTNVGCIPSKTLIHLAREGGLSSAQILKKVREKRDHLREEETEWLGNMDGVTLKLAEARFAGTGALDLYNGGEFVEQVTAHNIVICTGAGPLKIPINGLPAERYLTNESLFELPQAPPHLAIVGGGVIGIEMAFAFARLGSRVSLIEGLPRLCRGGAEPEASEVVQRCLERAGVEVWLNCTSERFEPKTASLVVKRGEQELALEAVDKVLVAVGRRPNLDLDLDRVGVTTTRAGIETDDLGHTGVGNIYAIGDVNLRSAFTHSANHQGRRLLRKLLVPFAPLGSEPHYPSVIFGDPEVARVGPLLEELHKICRPQLITTVKVDLKDTDRGYTCSLQDGFVMLHAMRLTGRLLSATVVAPQAGEMIPLLNFAVNNGVSLYKLADLVFPYPTLSEAIKKASDQFVLSTLPKLHREAFHYLANRWRSPT